MSALNRVRGGWLILGLVIASFGPYVILGAGLRTEHFLVYSLLPLALCFLPFRRPGVLAYPPVALVVACLAFVTLWTLAVTALGPRHFDSPTKVVSHLENYLQPIAILLVIGAFVRPQTSTEALRLFRGVCSVLIWMLVFNTVVAVASVFFDLSGLLKYFAGQPDEAGFTVWALAAQMGRFSGIFNQPMESGLTYSLGLFAWGYLVRHKLRLSLWDFALLGVLLLGGVLSVSKAFILGGFPLFVLYWLSLGRLPQLFSWRFGLIALAAAAGVAFVFQHWTGLGFFLRLFQPDSAGGLAGLLVLYTAHRFGEETEVKELMASVLQDAPIQGLGFASATILDNGYLEFLFQGGIVALVGYLGILVVMGWLGFKHFVPGSEEGRLLFFSVVFVVGASLGAPVLTINRFSTIFWVFFAGICIVLSCRAREAGPGRQLGEATASAGTVAS